MVAIRNIENQKFNRLFVLEKDYSKKRTAYSCLCDCGNKIVVTTDRLVSGKTKSCGCLKKEHQLNFGKNHGIKPTHGMTKTSTFKTWRSVIYRCTNKNSRQYSVYGGMLCERWKEFKNFYEDMGDRPLGKTLDRIDVYKGYFKENCRWATAKEQQNNKTNTRYLIVDGNVISLMNFADQLGIKKSAAQYFFSVLKRINKKNQKVNIWDC